MKLAIIQHLIGAGGGNDHVLFSLLDSLKEHDITIFTFSKPLIDLQYKVKTVIPIKIPFMGLYQQFSNMKVPKELGKMDFIFNLTGHMILNNTNTPMIYYNQNSLGSYETPLKYRHGMWKIYYKPYEKLLRSFYNRVKNSNIRFVSVSKYSQQVLYDGLGIHSDVIYPPVNLSEFYMSEKKDQVCVIGRISPEKNLENTVSLLNKTRHKCILFGSVSAINIPYLNRLKKLANDNIHFIANGSREELLSVMAESKISFTTSNETFGITTVESIASGCIPIVPNHSAHSEVVPFEELRYKFESDIPCMLDDYMDSNIQETMTQLQQHIQQFDKKEFSKRMLVCLK